MPTVTRTHYELLDVARDVDAETLKKAYRKLAKATHPDTPTGSTALFGLVNDAYEVLKDPARRAAYDRELDRPQAPSSASSDQSGRRADGSTTGPSASTRAASDSVWGTGRSATQNTDSSRTSAGNDHVAPNLGAWGTHRWSYGAPESTAERLAATFRPVGRLGIRRIAVVTTASVAGTGAGAAVHLAALGPLGILDLVGVAVSAALVAVAALLRVAHRPVPLPEWLLLAVAAPGVGAFPGCWLTPPAWAGVLIYLTWVYALLALPAPDQVDVRFVDWWKTTDGRRAAAGLTGVRRTAALVGRLLWLLLRVVSSVLRGLRAATR